MSEGPAQVLCQLGDAAIGRQGKGDRCGRVATQPSPFDPAALGWGDRGIGGPSAADDLYHRHG